MYINRQMSRNLLKAYYTIVSVPVSRFKLQKKANSDTFSVEREASSSVDPSIPILARPDDINLGLVVYIYVVLERYH